MVFWSQMRRKERTKFRGSIGRPVRPGQEGERTGVTRPHDGEVPMIQRRDLGELQAPRDGDHRGIDDAEWQVQVGLDKLGHPVDVLAFEFSDVEAVAAERFEEGDFRLRSHPRGVGTSSGPSAWRSSPTYAR